MGWLHDKLSFTRIFRYSTRRYLLKYNFLDSLWLSSCVWMAVFRVCSDRDNWVWKIPARIRCLIACEQLAAPRADFVVAVLGERRPLGSRPALPPVINQRPYLRPDALCGLPIGAPPRGILPPFGCMSPGGLEAISFEPLYEPNAQLSLTPFSCTTFLNPFLLPFPAGDRLLFRFRIMCTIRVSAWFVIVFNFFKRFCFTRWKIPGLEVFCELDDV